MQTFLSYINGEWLKPSGTALAVHNPADENIIGQVILGTDKDTDRAVQAASLAFQFYSKLSLQERLGFIEAMRDEYAKRIEDIALAMCQEMGAPITFSREAQATSGLGHFDAHLNAAREFKFEYSVNTSLILHEPIGVAALITPWNWPMNQLVAKVIPALIAGCTMVVKPSEISPISANIFAEVVDAIGLPAGVFNLLHGDGQGVGQALSKHPLVDLVSFTGSIRAGTAITQAAADTVKRVTLELGGKSPNLILRDADFESAVSQGVQYCMANTGQSCDAPSRMYVPKEHYQDALALAKQSALSLKTGNPLDADTDLGPVVSQLQYERIQNLIQVGIEEGAEIVCGGLGKPSGLEKGYYVKTTIFGQVSQNMRIAREEVFGPVLVIIPYEDEDQLIEFANDSEYGLSSYISSVNLEHANQIARKLRTGQVQINYPEWDLYAPFGGYKKSGNGREYAQWGLVDYLETKAIVGYAG